MNPGKSIWIGILCCALALVPTVCRAAEDLVFRISGERATLRAQNVPVRRVLEQMASEGLRVRIDPSLDFRVSADFADRDLRSAMASILKPADHVLVWEAVEGPVGPITRLAEVQVFKAGRKDRIRLLALSTRRIVADPESGGHYVAGELLIRVKSGATREVFEKMLERIDGRVVDVHPALGIYRVRVPSEDALLPLVERLSDDPAMDAVEPNAAYPLIGSRPSGAVPLTATAPAAWHLSDEPVRIAVLDTGISAGEEHSARVVSTFNAVDPEMPATDDLGHGTRMALIASGEVLPEGIRLEPNELQPVVVVKAFDESGYISSFDFARSIDFTAAQGARVMNLSWGSGHDSRFLADALAYADRLGIVVVAASGNEPTGEAMYPAAYDTVIGVGALAPDGKPWESSNFGAHVAIYAPGFAGFDTDGDGMADERVAGTSVSTAFVSHLVAGMISTRPETTREQLLAGLNRLLAPNS